MFLDVSFISIEEEFILVEIPEDRLRLFKKNTVKDKCYYDQTINRGKEDVVWFVVLRIGL